MITILDQLNHDIYDYSDLITKINIAKTCAYTMVNHRYEYDVFKNVTTMKRKHIFRACDLAQIDLIWSLHVGPLLHYAVRLARACFPKIVSIQLRKNLVPFEGHTYGMPGPVFMKQKYIDTANYILNTHTFFSMDDDLSKETNDNFSEYMLKYINDICNVSKDIKSPSRKQNYSTINEDDDMTENTNQIWPQVFNIMLHNGDGVYATKYLLAKAIKYTSPDTALSLCTADPIDIYSFISRGYDYIITYLNNYGVDNMAFLYLIYNKYIGPNKFHLTAFVHALCVVHRPEAVNLLFSKWTTREIIKNIKDDDLVRYICANLHCIRKDYISELSQEHCEILFMAVGNITNAMKLYNRGRISVLLIRQRYESRPEERPFWGGLLDKIVPPSATRIRRMQVWGRWYPSHMEAKYTILSKRRCKILRQFRMQEKYGRKILNKIGRININDHIMEDEENREDYDYDMEDKCDYGME